MVVPVHERALGIFPPCPHVEFEERQVGRNGSGEPSALTQMAVDVLHQVTIHLRSGVGCKSAHEYYELHPN